MPDQASRPDSLGRLPLHVAAGCRCSHPAVRVLVDRHPAACLVRDDDGRTPLILACDAGCELFEGDAPADVSSAAAKGSPCLDVVRALSTCVRCVPLEDRDGMSALEHAIVSGADMRVVRTLQHLERRVGEGHAAQGGRRGRTVDHGAGGAGAAPTDDGPAGAREETAATICGAPRRVSDEEPWGGPSPAKRRRSVRVDVGLASMHAVYAADVGKEYLS